jgi:hypothetical protein
MVGSPLTHRRQEAAILVDLAHEEIAVARHAVTMRMELEVDPFADDLTQFLRIHEMQDPLVADGLQVNLQVGS